MAHADIMPFNERGQVRPPTSYLEMDPTVTAAGEDTAFLTGNIIVLDPAVGDVLPHTDGTLNATNAHFISAAPSAGLFQTVLGHQAPTTAAHRNILVPLWDVMADIEFVTANVYTGNDTELDLNTVLIGDTVGFWVDDAVTTVAGHKHGLDTAGTGLQITRKLDAQGRDSNISGQQTVRVCFKAQR